mmetsp:Transcript_30362/g.90519  ORF Transcript_30362/g.90519 Transcript_30362/m.90519 type:complete len:273 (+) Transcript_30362:3802-4620(+)
MPRTSSLVPAEGKSSRNPGEAASSRRDAYLRRKSSRTTELSARPGSRRRRPRREAGDAAAVARRVVAATLPRRCSTEKGRREAAEGPSPALSSSSVADDLRSELNFSDLISAFATAVDAMRPGRSGRAQRDFFSLFPVPASSSMPSFFTFPSDLSQILESEPASSFSADSLAERDAPSSPDIASSIIIPNAPVAVASPNAVVMLTPPASLERKSDAIRTDWVWARPALPRRSPPPADPSSLLLLPADADSAAADPTGRGGVLGSFGCGVLIR